MMNFLRQIRNIVLGFDWITAQPKITESNLAHFIDENIVWLNISMDQIRLMNVINTIKHVVNYHK